MLITELKAKETILSLITGKVFIINCHGCKEIRFPEQEAPVRQKGEQGFPRQTQGDFFAGAGGSGGTVILSRADDGRHPESFAGTGDVKFSGFIARLHHAAGNGHPAQICLFRTVDGPILFGRTQAESIFFDVEKIRFTNTKSYRKKQQRNQKEIKINDFSAKLDYWVPVSDSRTNNDPHITYSSYDGGGKVFDLNAHIDGFNPSMTEQEYYNDQLSKLFDTLNVNDIINMFYEYEYNRELWETVSCFNDFCHNHIQDCSTVVAQSLQEFDKYFNLKQTSRSSIETKSHFLVSPEKSKQPFCAATSFAKRICQR